MSEYDNILNRTKIFPINQAPERATTTNPSKQYYEGYIDKDSGVVRVKPFLDDFGNMIEYIPWHEL